MPAQLIVLYPRESGSKFDKDYYMSTHMPLVEKHWTKHGLKSYQVAELNEDGPYMISCVLDFGDHEGIGKAVADPATKEVLDDVDNFSSVKPVLQHGSNLAQK